MVGSLLTPFAKWRIRSDRQEIVFPSGSLTGLYASMRRGQASFCRVWSHAVFSTAASCYNHRQWAGGATERGAGKPHELAAGTAALCSAGLRPASSGGFQPPVLVVPLRCAPFSTNRYSRLNLPAREDLPGAISPGIIQTS